MPEFRIHYKDDSDRMPDEAIAKVVRAAGEHLMVTEFEWVRDDDLEPPEETVKTAPDLSAFTRAFEPHRRGARSMTHSLPEPNYLAPEFADYIDKGPDIPLRPSIYSALAREKAEDAARGGPR